MIYISYGIPKSASSFVFQLTRSVVGALAEKVGQRHFKLTDLIPECGSADFAEVAIQALGFSLDENGLEQLIDEIDARMTAQAGGFIVIKTHQRCGAGLRKRIAAGEILASACYRHPAEMILSRMDMVARQAECVSVDQIKGYYLKFGVPNFMSWVAEPAVRRFYYDTIVKNPAFIASQVCNQLGIAIETEQLLRPFLSDKSRIWQFNKGVLHRHQAEMSKEEIAKIEHDFDDYMRFIERAKDGLGDFRFAVVTPSLNSIATINETILSIVTQHGDFAIRYHIQDGGSTDGTIELLERWARILGEKDVPWLGCKGVEFSYTVEPDTGVYDALNRAFQYVSGDVYTWLGSDDRIYPGCMQTIATLRQTFPGAHWLTGPVSLLREDGVNCSTNPHQFSIITAKLHHQSELKARMAGSRFKFIQQEGTFWSDWLWQAVGQRLNSSLRLAGDFELWTRMAQHTDLVTVLAPLGAFRRRHGQLSSSMDEYMEEVKYIQGADGGSRHRPTFQELVTDTQATRVAYCSWPDGNWSINSVAHGRLDMRALPDGTHIQFLDFSGAGIKSVPHNAGARARVACAIQKGETLELEGPFPQANLHAPFYWLTGHESRLFLWSAEPGPHPIHLSVSSPIPGQQVTLSGTGLREESCVSAAESWGEAFHIEFVVDIPVDGYELRLEFSDTFLSFEEPRELACMLFAVDIHDFTQGDTRTQEDTRDASTKRISFAIGRERQIDSAMDFEPLRNAQTGDSSNSLIGQQDQLCSGSLHDSRDASGRPVSDARETDSIPRLGRQKGSSHQAEWLNRLKQRLRELEADLEAKECVIQNLALTCQERQTVIEGLKHACDERLELIEQLAQTKH